MARIPTGGEEFVKRLPLFSGVAPTVAAELTRQWRLKRAETGQAIFLEGDPCRDLYILVDGRVTCYRANAEGREQVLRVFDRPGDAFCLTAAFNTGRHIVSSKANGPTRLYVIDVPTVSRLAMENSSLAMALLATATGQTGELIVLAEGLALRTVLRRLARLLHKRAIAEGRPRGRGLELDRRRFREEEVASTVATVRVHVSRSLQQLARIGAVRLSRSTILIPDPRMLERLGEGAESRAGEPARRAM
jgi:CRP-like cAMP-binding protein